MANKPVERAGDRLVSSTSLLRSMAFDDRFNRTYSPRLPPCDCHLNGRHGRGIERRQVASLPHGFFEHDILRAACDHADAPNHSPHLIARSPRVGKPLEHKHHRPFARHITTAGSTIEHRCRTVRQISAERPALEGHQIHTPLAGGAEHRVAGSLAKHVDRGRNRRQARAVASIEGQRPTHQVEGLGESAGQRAAGETAGLVDECGKLFEHLFFIRSHNLLDVGRGDAAASEGRLKIEACFGEPQAHLQLVGKVAAKERADHDAGAHPIEALRAAGILDRCIGCLEEHELQRIGRGDLLWRHLVPPPVVDKITDKAPQVAGRVPGPRARVAKSPSGIKAVDGHRGNGRLATVESIEEGLEREPARQDAAGANDRDRLLVGSGLANRDS